MLYIEIEGIDYSTKLRRESVNIPDNINERNQTSFRLRGASGFRPSVGEEVKIKTNKGVNLYGVTETLNSDLITYNVEGVTETPDSSYNTINVAGLTENINTDYVTLNVYGITEVSDQDRDAAWVWAEGVTETHETQSVVYAGTINNITERELGYLLQWDISCISYEQILDRFVAPDTYTSETAGDIIVDLVSQFVPESENILLYNKWEDYTGKTWSELNGL